MLIVIIGENCVGKSTLAESICREIGGKIFNGKDFLRLERNPDNAKATFKVILSSAVDGDNLIYVITEREHLDLLPEGAVKIVLTADLEAIKDRFKARMRGILPPPVEKMLEQNHGKYDDLPCDIKLKSGEYDLSAVIERLKSMG
ncbi:MAG: hypothetical protein IKA59_00640 [Clostridia bacterium]|nr:hypothetical protein [Clostridia bacterium]